MVEFWKLAPRVLVMMLGQKREIDLAKIRRLALETSVAIWTGKNTPDDSGESEEPYDPF